MRIFLVLLITLSGIYSTYNSCHAQEADSVVVYDTVTIEKDPIIITRTVVLPPLKKQTPPKFFLGLSGGISYYFRYYNVCEQCVEFYRTTLRTNKATISYSAGISFLYLPKKIFLSGEFNYSPYREKFKFKDTTEINYNTINKTVYAEGFLGGGISIGDAKKTQLLISAEAKMSFRTHISGYIPDTSTQQAAVLLTTVHQYRKTIPGFRLSARLLTRIAYRTYLMPELSYSYDLRSIVENDGPFTIQRHITSVRFSLIRGF